MKINNESKKICSQWTIRNSLAYIIQLSRLSVIVFLDRLFGRCKTRSNGLTYVCKWECKWANSTRYLCVQALTWSLEICIVAWKTLERRARRALIVRFKGQFRGKESIAEGGLPFNSCEFFFFSPLRGNTAKKTRLFFLSFSPNDRVVVTLIYDLCFRLVVNFAN